MTDTSSARTDLHALTAPLRDDGRDLTPDDRYTMTCARDAQRPRWRAAYGWQLLGLVVTAWILALGFYAALHVVSGYWRGW